MQPKSNDRPSLFDPQEVKNVRAELESAQSVLVLLPPTPSSDQIGSALALYLALENSGKVAQIGCGTPIKVEDANFFGVDKIKTSVGNQNLIISFDFKEENLKKVDYDIDAEGHFNLLIQPQPGVAAPDSSTVRFSYSGANADLVFAFGLNNSLEELGKIYADEKAFLDDAKIVVVNFSSRPATLGSFKLNLTSGSCLAEGVAHLIKAFRLNLNEDIAQNLLSVIMENTSQFTSPKTSADTFEVVAFLLRAGAKLGRTTMATNSRFGAFPPVGFNSPMAPTFEEEYEPTPFPKMPRPKIIRGNFPPVPTDLSGR